MEFLIALLTLVAGLVIGWLVARQRGEASLRAALTATAALRAGIDAEREATSRREQLLMGNGNLASLVAPLRDSLGRVQQQLDEVQRGRAVSDTALREQVRAMSATSELLRTETSQLVTALRAPQVRGRWGEMQLERVVELAGMTEHVDFTTQLSSTDRRGGSPANGDGGPPANRAVARGEGVTQRPDLVVHLAGGKQVVVDSKVAFIAYLEAMQATDEATRDARFAAHARHVRAHIDSLSAKAYWERFTPTPEFVVCFIPADAFLDAALREDAGLLEHAFAHNVVLATPSTLVALLRTVAYTWRQDALAHNAEQVHELGRELYQRLSTMGRHVDRLGKSLGNAVGAYNDTVGSLERRVFTQARRMHDLGVAPAGAELDELLPLTDAVPRTVSMDGLAAQRVVALRPQAPHGAQAAHGAQGPQPPRPAPEALRSEGT